MTNQEAFDTVVRHLLTQKRRSGNDKICLYRGNAGLRCAVGVLIPDDQYKPEFEDLPVTDIQDQVPALCGVDSVLLRSLQHVHDVTHTERWAFRLRVVGERFGLNLGVLNEFPLGVEYFEKKRKRNLV